MTLQLQFYKLNLHDSVAPARHGSSLPLITMGIKGLTKLLSDRAPGSVVEYKLDRFSGHQIAVDASMSIYQFLIVVGRKGPSTLTNKAGDVTSHLQGMFTRTIRLLEAGIKPVYVFDGIPPELKKVELLKRSARRSAAATDLANAMEKGDDTQIEKYSKRTVKVSQQQNEDCCRLLRLMGLPVVMAPGEAEAECAALCKAGKVHAVCSEDMDSLTFGAPKLLRHLMHPISHKLPVLEFDLLRVLQLLDLTMDQFIDLCILCGCDYCNAIKGIGPQTALKLIRQHGMLEVVLQNVNKDRYQISNAWPFREARKLFREPLVTAEDDQSELHWSAPDEEGLANFLVKENGFNYERIVKGLEKIKVAMGKWS